MSATPTTPVPSAPPSAAAEQDARNRRRAGRAAFIGTLLEYYDFTLFGLVAATVFPTVFFAGASPFMATLLSIATFSIAFVIRPFSGALLGSLGDRLGRRKLLFFSMMVMGVATVGIGLIPGVASIGTLAPALLIAMRVLQGVGASAEYSGATLVAVEFAPTNRRGLLGSLPGLGGGLGTLTGTLILLLAQAALTREQFLAWGWRVPFLIGGAILAYGLWIRSRLPETPEFVNATSVSRAPLRETLRRYPRALTGSVLLFASRTGLAYFLIVFLVSHAVGKVGLAAAAAFAGVLVAQIVNPLLIPVFGRLSDAVGRFGILAGGLLLIALMAFPLFWWFIRPDWPAGFAVGLVLAYGVGIAALIGPSGRLMAEEFPVRYRYTAMGVGIETGTAVGGAVVPPLAVALTFSGTAGTAPLSLLVMALAVLGLAGLALLRWTGSRNRDTENRDTPSPQAGAVGGTAQRDHPAAVAD
ncbi:MFS transporter [Pseudonocardia sp. GCM10023141]|uniref:MFS transporter n=1 Tax=Pseudonocardia sp. GCM10023141 TaxID=3252653 RepID=UPI00361102FF